MIPKNSRQIPSSSIITKQKDYCDLLYAWLQCNSELGNAGGKERKILKKKIKWAAIEKDFTRVCADGTSEKVMSRKTIAKYFEFLKQENENGFSLVYEREDDPDYYYLRLLDSYEANLVQYNTLSKMLNVLQKNSINIYIFLLNEFYRHGQQPFITTMKYIKDFIGISTSTTSNNLLISDTLDILQRLGLLKYQVQFDAEANKSFMEFFWVVNELPRVDSL